MRNLPRAVAAAGAVVLLGLSLTACGSDGSDAPKNASKDEFCKVFNSDSDDEDKVLDELKEVGTPKEIDGDAREGFEIFIDKYDDLKDLDSESEALKELGDEDGKKVSAFISEAIAFCVGDLEVPDLDDLESDLPDGLPTE